MTATHDNLNQPTDSRDLPHPDVIRDLNLQNLTGLPDDQMVDVFLVLMAYEKGIIKPVVQVSSTA